MRHEARLERILTDQQPTKTDMLIFQASLARSKSNHLKTKMAPKGHSVINRIIFNSQTSEPTLD
jgi:hypothetical protein